MRFMYRNLSRIGVTLFLAFHLAPAKAAEPAPGNMRFAWIHGSISARHNTDVRIQVHRYNEHTYILRQNPAVHWEAPFMYLLFGQSKAVLLDTGATEEAEYFPLRATVDRVIERWQDANDRELTELVVLTSSDAPAQTAGLAQFEDRPRTRVIEPTPAAVSAALGISSWPTETAVLDLGERPLVVLPTPGTATMALSIYDPATHFLMTGTTVLPGRIVIRDFDAYHASIDRLLALSAAQPVKWVMGAQIDMTTTPGLDYRLRSNFRPEERALQLSPDSVGRVREVVNLINGAERIEVLPDFIVMNGVGRGARAWGYPVYMPEYLQKPGLR